MGSDMSELIAVKVVAWDDIRTALSVYGAIVRY